MRHSERVGLHGRITLFSLREDSSATSSEIIDFLQRLSNHPTWRFALGFLGLARSQAGDHLELPLAPVACDRPRSCGTN